MRSVYFVDTKHLTNLIGSVPNQAFKPTLPKNLQHSLT